MLISIITPSHAPSYLAACLDSLLAQVEAPPWEWWLIPNTDEAEAECTRLAREDPRILVRRCEETGVVGGIKRFGFGLGTGEVLLELDHDDMLAPRALAAVCKTMADRSVDFCYSDTIDFPDGHTYHVPERRTAWERDGWRFARAEESPVGPIDYPLSWEPSARALSAIQYAPNHLRAWRREFYARIGGHASLAVCDDHELLIRTYLAGTMRRIAEPLYYYRVHGQNTWLARNREIQIETQRLRNEHLHRLVERECALAGAPMFDLCAGIDPTPAPWVSVDLEGAEVQADLRARWPFGDHSVGAFRAFDALEHLPDKLHTMREIYRCLRPGGWLLSRTPSAVGQGAFQDPTHVSYWVENSFRYYTEARLARYIRNTTERFMAGRLFTTHEAIPYVVADLVSLKDDDRSLPGQRLI